MRAPPRRSIVLWWRVAARPDRRLVAAAAGIAFAILLPVAGTLVLQGLEPDIQGDWIVYRTDGGDVRRGMAGLKASLWTGAENGTPVAALLDGDPVVAQDQAMGVGIAVPDGLRDRTLATRAVPLVPPGHVLVHPATVPAQRPQMLLLAGEADVPGAMVVPARGADAFERAGLEGLQAQTLLLVAASVPAVALVAAVFADAEARRRARTAATLAALGRPSLARWLLAGRVALTGALGVVLATAMGYVLWRFGGATFRPADAQPRAIAIAIAVPGALGALAGVAWGVRRLGSGEDRLRTPPAETDLPGWRIPWLPATARPLALGTRVVPILVLAGLLFAVDIGFPLAAAGVPAAVAGERGEWVVGADTGIVLGGQTSAAPAAVMAHDPAIDAIVAEILVPTLVAGRPAILRGGDLGALADYHDLRVTGDEGLVLGGRLARHLDARIGDVVAVQAADQATVVRLEVTGVFGGGGLLADEGILDADMARSLAGIPDGRATLLRMRPDDLAARDALGRSQPRIEVTALRVLPDPPVAGHAARVEVDAVALSSAAATRVLPVRVNDIVVGQIVVSLPGHARGTFGTDFVVPHGTFGIEVNPTATIQPSTAAIQASAPLIVFQPDPLRVVLRGHDVAGRTVELVDAEGAVAATATTDDGGVAALSPEAQGKYTIRAGDVHRTVRVGADEDRNRTVLRVGATWIEPDRPAVGTRATWHAEIVNWGGAAGTRSIRFESGGSLITTQEPTLLGGQTVVVHVPLFVNENRMQLRAGNETLSVDARPLASPGSDGRNVDARTAGSLQVEVADRVLGNAQRALVGLGTIALAAILAIVYLGTERTLDGRRHVVRTLHALGMSPEQIRHRAAWEAAAMAGVCFLGAAAVAKLAFIVLGRVGWPRPFAHSLPDPVTWLFVLQAGAAFAGAAALAAYMASARALEQKP